MEIEKQALEKSDVVAKATALGKLEGDKKWYEWDLAMDNHLSSMMGVSGVPLNYVVRRDEFHNPEALFEGHRDEMVACAPLHGFGFEQDKVTVHHIIKGCVQGTPSWDWISHLDRKGDGLQDYLALRAHYEGRGSMS